MIDYIVRIKEHGEVTRIIYTGDLMATLESYAEDELKNTDYRFEIQPVKEGYLYND